MQLQQMTHILIQKDNSGISLYCWKQFIRYYFARYGCFYIELLENINQLYSKTKWPNPKKKKFDLQTALDERGKKAINKDSKCDSATAKSCNNRSEEAINTKKLYNTTGIEDQNPDWYK